MSRAFWLTVVILLAVFAASPTTLVKIALSADQILTEIKVAFVSADNHEITEEQIRFVGDIMLGRHVETLIKQNGPNYPYQHMESQPSIKWVGNFEATVPDEHTQTKNFNLNFSVDRQFLTPLSRFGFTHLSLANNHSFDFGNDIFKQTQNNLSDFTVFGLPNEVSDGSLSYIQMNDKTVGMIGLHVTEANLDPTDYLPYVSTLGENSDFQIAYIHWGEEYELVHNEFQENLARQLIASGIDLIIGHHPHVVQDIDYIDGRLVFYSLGNFIFDQYFDPAVQSGLMLSLREENEELVFDLIPLTTKETLASPQEMVGKEAKLFMKELAERSDEGIYFDILARQINVTYK